MGVVIGGIGADALERAHGNRYFACACFIAEFWFARLSHNAIPNLDKTVFYSRCFVLSQALAAAATAQTGIAVFMPAVAMPSRP
jgi:hypothetical protein